jgi:uncharacterized membrane protein (UPF0127 family)
MPTGDPTTATDTKDRDPDAKVKQLRRCAFAILALSLGVLVIRGADRPKNPKLVPPGGVIPSRTVPGFGEVGFKVAGPALATALTSRTRCALLASTTVQQQRGLMNRHDLGGYDGMIFRFDSPTTVGFYMKDTLIPLSIAWFNRTGQFLNGTTMVPCPKKTVTCPSYFADAPYSVAIEVRAGGLPELGIGPGSTITANGPC